MVNFQLSTPVRDTPNEKGMHLWGGEGAGVCDTTVNQSCVYTRNTDGGKNSGGGEADIAVNTEGWLSTLNR